MLISIGESFWFYWLGKISKRNKNFWWQDMDPVYLNSGHLKNKGDEAFSYKKEQNSFFYKTVDSLYFSCSCTWFSHTKQCCWTQLFQPSRKRRVHADSCMLESILVFFIYIPLEYRGKFSISLGKEKSIIYFVSHCHQIELWGSKLY